MASDDESLIALAAAVADGTAVDWAEAEARAASVGHADVIRQLRALADLANVHRSGSAPSASIGRAEPPPGFPPSTDVETLRSLQDGRLVIERRLGKGGFGVVYQAYDRNRAAHVALKSLNHSDAASIYDLKTEFRALADLSHPNLVSLHRLFAEGDRWFIEMELVNGVDFLTYVRAGWPDDGAGDESLEGGGRRLACDLTRLESLMFQLAEALSYLHTQGKLHRDIKPSNLLVTPDGHLKLLDFGLTVDLTPDAGGDTVHIRGTPAYVSPEQAVGGRATEASDWYSVGVLMFEALTGRRPFAGTYAQVLEAKQQREGPSPASLCDGIPERLDALCRDLIERRPERRPSYAEVITRLRRVWPGGGTSRPQRRRRERAAFIGRATQLDILARAYQASALGRAQIVYVHGGSGMGKTALIQRFLEQLRERDPTVVILKGRCYERESVPYKALDNLVDRLSHFLRRLPRAEVEAVLPCDVSALARLFPVLRRVDAIAEARLRASPVSNAQELRRRGFAAFRELMARLSHRHSVVLVIDDLQWGDTDSAALIAELIYTSEPPPLLFIASYRSEEAFNSDALTSLLFAPQDPSSPADVHQVVVDALTEGEAHELAAALSLAYSATTPVGAIVRESGRSPFFIDELIQYSAAIANADGAGGSADLETSNELTLDSVIRARTSRLGDGALRLLRVLAVYGGPLKLALATEAAGLAPGALDEVTALRVAHLTRTRLGAAGEEIEVYHDRIRETVVAQIPEGVLQHLHAQLAIVVEQSAGAGADTLVAHLQGAGQHEAAAVHALVAADGAREALAFDRAARYYRLALDIGQFDRAKRRDVEIKLGDALAAGGRGYDAAQSYLSAAQGALAAELLELQRRAADQLLRSGHIDEGLRAIRAVLDALGMKLAVSPTRALASLLVRRSWIRIRGLSFRERDRSQISAEDLVRVDACWSVATTIGVVDTICGADFQARHLLLALDLGDPYRIARALAVETAYTALLGSATIARQQHLTGIAQELANRVGQLETHALVMLATGTASFFQGNWKAANDCLERADPMFRECSTGIAWELDTTHLYHLLALFYLGEIKELCTRLPAFLKEARERDDLTAATNLRTRTGYIMQLAADAPELARDEVRQGMSRWAQDGFHAQHSWELYASGEIDLYEGHGLAAWNYVTERWMALRRSMLMRIQAVRVEALYLRARSALAATRDPSLTPAKRASLIRLAERDAAKLGREGAAWGPALAHLILGGASTVRSDTGAAISRLHEAEAAFEKIDMGLHTAVARRRRGQLIGGSAGELLVKEADGWMRTQAIRNPARIAAMLAPGAFEDS